MKKLLLLLIMVGICGPQVYAQQGSAEDTMQQKDISTEKMLESLTGKSDILLLDMNVQIEATTAINYMYNFEFAKAEAEFKWMKRKYPDHPLPYFLLGLSEWWKIVPNIENEQYDDRFMAYMDSSIMKAEAMYDKNEENIEASFFLSAAYGFKGRLLSERKSWRRATFAGKTSLDYLNETQRDEDFGPEFLFGDALYNYYSIWVPENYPMLKPILLFFRKGDKQKGIEQLREVAANAFYTRTEAQFFLMRILAGEGKTDEALSLARYLHSTFPDNPYFHRYLARMLYAKGRYRELEPVAKNLLEQIESGKFGYEEVSGRYAAFYLGQIHSGRRDLQQAKYYYQKAIIFCKAIEEDEAGYYLWSNLYLGKIAKEEGQEKLAKTYFRHVKRKADRGDAVWRAAKEQLRNL